MVGSKASGWPESQTHLICGTHTLLPTKYFAEYFSTAKCILNTKNVCRIHTLVRLKYSATGMVDSGKKIETEDDESCFNSQYKAVTRPPSPPSSSSPRSLQLINKRQRSPVLSDGTPTVYS